MFRQTDDLNQSIVSSIPSFQVVTRSSTSSFGPAVRITIEMVHSFPCGLEGVAPSEPSGIASSTNITENEKQVDSEEHVEAEEQMEAEEQSINALPDDAKNAAIQMIIFFENGDINSVIRLVLDSLGAPFGQDSVTNIFVQDSICDEFRDRLVYLIRSLPEHLATSPNYIQTLANLEHADDICKCIQCSAGAQCTKDSIFADYSDARTRAMLMCDCSAFCVGDTRCRGLISLYTFATTKDVVETFYEYEMVASAVSIWNDSLDNVYELVGQLSCGIFCLNCHTLSLSPILSHYDAGQNYVTVTNGYHYETLDVHGQAKMIVFPVRTMFEKKLEEEAVKLAPIEFLDE